MVQFGRPDGDVSVGLWSGSSGGSLYTHVDEATASDSDYIASTNSTGSDDAELSLSDVTDPTIHTGHTIRVRARRVISATQHLTVQVFEGGTQIAVPLFQQALTDAFATYSATLTTTQAGNIADYSNLRLRFTKDASGIANSVRVSWAEMEFPNPPTQSITATGQIASAEAFGTASLSKTYSISGAGGVASALAFGTLTVLRGTVTLTPTGVASGEAIGTHRVAHLLYLGPTGIGSEEALGDPQLNLILAPTGIASANAWGSATVLPGPVVVLPSGVASTEVLGTPIVSSLYTLVASGIGSSELVGNPYVVLIRELVELVAQLAPGTLERDLYMAQIFELESQLSVRIFTVDLEA